MRRYLSTLPLSLLGLLTLSAASVAQAADQGAERVLSVLQARFPDAQIGTPQPSSITGYYEVNLGSQVLYVSGNGRYLILGDLIDLKSDANLSEARRADLRRQLLGQVDPGSLIVFGSASPRRVITAFTNIHCQYCRNLHQSLKSVLAQGDVRFGTYCCRMVARGRPAMPKPSLSGVPRIGRGRWRRPFPGRSCLPGTARHR